MRIQIGQHIGDESNGQLFVSIVRTLDAINVRKCSQVFAIDAQRFRGRHNGNVKARECDEIAIGITMNAVQCVGQNDLVDVVVDAVKRTVLGFVDGIAVDLLFGLVRFIAVVVLERLLCIQFDVIVIGCNRFDFMQLIYFGV